MLVEDLCKIENGLQKIVDNLISKFLEQEIDVSIETNKIGFYLVNKFDYDEYLRDGTTFYYQQKGYFDYGLITEFYYNCSKDNFTQFIKNKYCHIYDFHTLIKTISHYISDEGNEKINIIIDINLLRSILLTLRKKLNKDSLSYLIDLYPIYNQIPIQFNFYIAYYEYEIFKLFYKDFSIGIGYDIHICLNDYKIDTTKVLNNCTSFIYKQATNLFNKNLKHIKFLIFDKYYFNEEKYNNLIFTLVFKMNNLEELIKISIIDELYKYL